MNVQDELQLPEISRLLQEWSAGDSVAGEQVIPLVREELLRVAARHLRRELPQRVEASSIVQETFEQLSAQRRIDRPSRSYFLGVAAHLLRRALVAYARRRRAEKRSLRPPRVALAEGRLVTAGEPPEVLAIDRALEDLSALDPMKGSISELLFFGGLTISEAAEYLGISEATVEQHWENARRWLAENLAS